MAVNTRILPQELECLFPKTIHEAVQMLTQYGPDAKVVAGGTDLLVRMKQGLISPGYLILIMKIPELINITKDECLRIGAATRLCEVLNFCAADEKYAAMSEALRSLGKVQIRNLATIGGNLCNASPAADSAPPLLVFDCRVKLCSVKGERILNLEKFFKKRRYGGLHHITLQTPAINTAKQILKENNIPYFGYNEHGDVWKEIFVHPKDAFGVLIQIAEFNADDWLNKALVFPKNKKWAIRKKEDGCMLTFAHPGGGKVDLELTKTDIKKLISDLEQSC